MQVVNLTVQNGKCLLIEATQWASSSLRPLSQRKNMDRINLFYLGWSPPTGISWQIQITTSAIGLVKNGTGSSQRSILINMPKWTEWSILGCSSTSSWWLWSVTHTAIATTSRPPHKPCQLPQTHRWSHLRKGRDPWCSWGYKWFHNHRFRWLYPNPCSF